MPNVAAAVVNFQTPELLDVAVRSFHAHNPGIPLLVIDNGSRDHSGSIIERLQADLGDIVKVVWLSKNVYHGPAMDLALRHLRTSYVFILDSDTETRAGNFLEPMMALLDTEEKNYGAGHLVRANRRGFVDATGFPVLSSAHMLLKRSIYFDLPPFIHHGLPAVENFRAAAAKGYNLLSFPIQDYVHHLGRGTASRYGYGLGLRSKVDYMLNKLGL